MIYRKLLAGAAIAALAFASVPALAGSIIITGHDPDDHASSQFNEWAVTALLNNGNGSVANRPTTSNTTAKIAYIGNSQSNTSAGYGNYDNITFYDLDSPTWTNAFSQMNQLLIIGAGLDFVSPTGSAALNAQAAAFTAYFNGGGNILVNTDQGLGTSFYGFLPSFGATIAGGLTTCSTETGNGACMNTTALGAAAGMLLSDIQNANITHTQYANVDPVFKVLSTYVPTGQAITIGLFGASINSGGGFVGTPEPAALGLLGLGLAGIGLRSRRRR